MNSLAAIHVAKKQLGLDEDTYRAMLVTVTGKASTKEMSEPERQRVIEQLRKRGFKKASKPSRFRAAGPYRAKLQALWIAMWNLGLVEDPSDSALTAFVRRQAKLDHTRFLIHAEDASAVIEALKDWMAREAGVDWTQSRFLPAWTQAPGCRIARAQWATLKRLAPGFTGGRDLMQWLSTQGVAPFALDGAAGREWIIVMNHLGVAIRKAKR